MRRTLVRQYRRRHPTTPRREVRKAIRTLERLGADKDLKHVCEVQLSDDPSQVLPGRAGFRRGSCCSVNLEPRDSIDEVGAAFTLQHEGVHARTIAKKGPAAISGEEGKRHEIEAHEETIQFGEDWLRREKDPHKKERIKEELAEEAKSVQSLATGEAR